MNPAAIPVIVGVGEITDRTRDPLAALSPAALMAAAIKHAANDAGARELLAETDSLDIVNTVTGDAPDLTDNVAKLAGISPPRAVHGPVGGESPLRLIHEAATRIMRGQSKVALVCGAEAAHAEAQARRQAISLPWAGKDLDWNALLGHDRQFPLAVRLDVAEPTNVYPLYENATLAAWRDTPAQAHQASARLWAQYAAVAADNPYAWIEKAPSAEEISQVSSFNRMIAYPYPKLMVANPQVNQGAAILITSLAHAQEMGAPEDRIIHFVDGASANEPANYLQRDTFTRSHAMEAVLSHCQSAADNFDAVELYSCFPCVPKMAKRVLKLAQDAPPTVTGGLTFFGAPLNNYMTHAVAAMVRQLRVKTHAKGLVYGQGEFVTKHHALVLSSTPQQDKYLPEDHDISASSDAARKDVPSFVTHHEGPARLETFTVLYDLSNAVRHGVGVLRTNAGARTLARIPAHDTATLKRLTDTDSSPIGIAGNTRMAQDAIPEFSHTAP